MDILPGIQLCTVIDCITDTQIPLGFDTPTGENPITSGSAFLNGYNVSTQHQDACRFMGFCPQFDGLIGWLSLPLLL